MSAARMVMSVVVATGCDRRGYQVVEADLMRFARDDVNRVDNGDGTWSYPAVDNPDTAVKGRVTWRYDGQARFASEPEPHVGTFTYIVDAPVLDRDERVAQLELIDENGGLWRGVSFDGPTEIVVEVDDDVDPIGMEITWRPLSWTHYDCDTANGNGQDEHHWYGESRVQVGASNLTMRQKAIVEIEAAGYLCTGTIIRDDWVVTASHCLYDDEGDRVANTEITAELEWAGQVKSFNGSLTPTFDPDDYEPWQDWALLHLQSQFSASYANMNLSEASNGVLDGVGGNFHNIGYPWWIGGCEGASLLAFSDNNDITTHTADTLRWGRRLDHWSFGRADLLLPGR